MNVKRKKAPEAGKHRQVPVAPESEPASARVKEAIASTANEAEVPFVRSLQTLLPDRLALQPYLLRQAELARDMGSQFVGNILEAGQRNLAHGPQTFDLVGNWHGDLGSAAMSMRFNAAVHALARQGRPASLQALYRGEHCDFDGAVREALESHDSFIAKAMQNPTQTNEVGRAAAFVSALMVLSSQFAMPFELLELGSSAGLNLNLAHYAYDLGGVQAGNEHSAVKIAPEWRGPPPPHAPVEITSALGVDLNPLDPREPATAERLMSFIWADQPERLQRLEQALEVAKRYPPAVERANGAPWAKERLRNPQPAGLCRVVFHSMVLQYFGTADREVVVRAIHDAGARATSERPFAWISFEWTEARDEVRLLLTSWPEGKTQHLATCHPYGSWIAWKS